MHSLRPFALALLAASAAADPVPRWQLDAAPNPPEKFAHGEAAYWVFSCEVTNRGPELAPLALQFSLHRPGQPPLASGFYPEVADAFACRAGGFDHLNAEVRGEALLRLRARGRWLTGSDLRKRGELRVGETIHTVAVFRDDGRTDRSFDVLVSGLKDPAVLRNAEFYSPPLPYRHENRLLRLRCENRFGRASIVRSDEVCEALPAPFAKDRIPGLIEDLGSDDATVRRSAMDLLCRYVRPESLPIPDPATRTPLRVPPNPAVFVIPFRAPKVDVSAWRICLAAELARRSPGTYTETIRALLDEDQHDGFSFPVSMTDALRSDEATVWRIAFQTLCELLFQDLFGDVFLYDAGRAGVQVTPEALATTRAWREWWSRHSDKVGWQDRYRDWRTEWD